MNRKKFIQTTGISLASILVSNSLFAFDDQPGGQLINFPDEVTAVVNNQLVRLTDKGKQLWTYQDLIVNLNNSGKSIVIEIQSPQSALSAVPCIGINHPQQVTLF